MNHLDYCPFCGSEDCVMIKDDETFSDIGIAYQVECQHCSACGGRYIGNDDAFEDAFNNWNNPDLRPKTICHKVKRRFAQLQYDLTTLWGRY